MSDSVTDRIRAAVDYVELLRQSGVTVQGNRGLCPFHDSPRPDHQRKPGFVILDGRVGYCHGCGWKGDVFAFVQLRDGVDFRTALRFLADRAGIEIEDNRRGGLRFRGLRRGHRPRAVVRRLHPDPDLTAFAQSGAASTSDDQLQAHAELFGVGVATLRCLGAFVDSRWPGAMCFPMRRPGGQVVGVRVRARNGRKWCVPGSKNALFIPDGIDAQPLYLPEGPTDTAALLDLGVSAVGRSNASAGAQDVAGIAQGRDVVLVADADEAGQTGAARIASAVLPHATRVRIWTPSAKDVRKWIKGGATRDDLDLAVRDAREVRLQVNTSNRVT